MTGRALLPVLLGLPVLGLATGCASATRPTYGPAIGPTAIATAVTVSRLGSRPVGRLGEVVVDPAGDTVYANAQETTPGTGCDAVCRRTWPLLLAPAAGSATAGAAADATRLGVATLAGQRVLTYAGRVLHVYVGDAGPGSASGQNVQGVWAAVTVAGTPAQGVP